MPHLFDTLIRCVMLLDGSGAASRMADIGIRDGRIARIDDAGSLDPDTASHVVEGHGLVLSPGFIDVHTHDDTNVVRDPAMTPKISQGVTTVIVGNCGISAAPVTLPGDPPDPMNLLGRAEAFQYPDFRSYVDAVNAAQPSVNVAALVGHTALRSNHMDRFDRAASADEIAAMRAQLEESLAHGALGLSTGLAYANAFHAPTDEVLALAEPLANAGALYATHLRSEFAEILDAMDEAYRIGRHARVPVVISHLKCAGVPNWGRSSEVLRSLETAQRWQPVGCDCYPYTASSSTLDLKQVTSDFDIQVTWSESHPDMGGRLLADIAAEWQVDLTEAARRLQPAGAVYHCMDEADVRRILAHPLTMIGSDGLPHDSRPHPRLWGTFPRVLGHYARDRGMFTLEAAIHKMTGLSAKRFRIAERGLLQPGFFADVTVFDPLTIRDNATFEDPIQLSTGITAVFVNGAPAYVGEGGPSLGELVRAGRLLRRVAAAVE